MKFFLLSRIINLFIGMISFTFSYLIRKKPKKLKTNSSHNKRVGAWAVGKLWEQIHGPHVLCLVLLLSLQIITFTFWSPNGHLDLRNAIIRKWAVWRTRDIFTQVNWEILFQSYLSDRHQQNIQYFNVSVNWSIFPLLRTATEHSDLKWKKNK